MEVQPKFAAWRLAQGVTDELDAAWNTSMSECGTSTNYVDEEEKVNERQSTFGPQFKPDSPTYNLESI